MKILIIFFITVNIFAGDLKPPFLFPSAKVLPKGVRNLSYKGVLTGASNKANNNGIEQPLADPFFKDITFADLIDGKKLALDQAAIESIMFSQGKSTSDSFGSSTGDIDIKATAHVPVFAWGVLEKTTLGIAIPILQSSTNISTGVIQENEELYNAFRAELKSRGALTEQAEFNSKINNPIPSKLIDYGYSPLENENKTQLGDIKLLVKQQALNNLKNRLVFQAELTLPTGKDQDVDKLVDVASGDDQTDIGIKTFYEFIPFKDFTFVSAVGYTWQIKDSNPERVPEKSSSKITPDKDLDTQRNLGDLIEVTLGAQYRLPYQISLFSAYTFQYKGRDKYSGSQFSQERYDWMAIDSEQRMHSAQAGISFDTISLYRQGKFAIPISLTLNHTRVLLSDVFTSKNVVSDELTALDLSIFF